MRTNGVLGMVMVVVVSALGACAGATTSGPSRLPAARRPVDATFRCGGEPIVLTEDSLGPALLMGDRALENHWRDPDGDHFVTWEYQRGRHLALEYLVSTDRSTITRRVYDRREGAAYRVVASDDGVWRITGTATAELPCDSPLVAVRADAD